MEAASFSEMLVSIYQIAWCHILENRDLSKMLVYFYMGNKDISDLQFSVMSLEMAMS
jgi:hypothetical protein